MRIATLPALLGLASLPVQLGVAALAVAAPGAAGPSGHAVVKPFPGAKVLQQTTRNFDEYWMPLGRLTGESQAEKVESLGGRWTHSAYLTPAGRSVAEVFRHYEQQLAQRGFEVMYVCKGVECGEGGRKSNGDWWPLSDHRRFISARFPRPAGDLWVSVHVHARLATAPILHEVDVVEVKPPVIAPPPRNEADVATLQKELKAEGRVVLRSLGFAERRPAVLPGSEGVIRAIAELLARDPALKLYVVVHGDDTMPPSAGLDLTKKQASALVSVLTKQHRVAANRLHAAGVGPFAPTASNRTEEGRALNRRVELVAQVGARAGGPAASARR